MNVGNLVANLQLNIQQFTQSIQQATNQVRGMQGQLNNALGGSTQRNINSASSSVQNMGMKFKDLDRIVGGILISQLFYRSLNAIESATSAVVDFSASMERAQVQFSYFLGNRDKARDFLEVMKDFAATTPFATDQAIKLSTQLMNAGFAATQVRGVMSILSDAASATGGTPEQMDRIVLALTQIKSQGFLAGQEIRQLGNANIPIVKILQEQLGLTGAQLKDIGKIKIPGDVAVAGILKGLERFKGAGAEISNTWSGMWSNIRDDALIISDKMFSGVFKGMEGLTRKIRDSLEVMRKAITEGGVGGLFQAIIPPQAQAAVKSIVAGFQMLGQAFSILGKALGPIVKQVFGEFIVALGAVLPVLGLVAKTIATVAAIALQASPMLRFLAGAIIGLVVAQTAAKALMLLWSVTRLGLVAVAVGQAVTFLSKAIQVLFVVATATPIGRVIAIISAALIYLAYSSGLASKWLGSLQNQLAGFGGIDMSKMFQPDQQKPMQDMLNEFTDSIDHMNEDLTKTGTTAAAAGKKVKDSFISSFDEVFQIPDKLDKVNDGLAGIGNTPFPKIPEISLPKLDLPNITPPGGVTDSVPWWAVRPKTGGNNGGGNNSGGGGNNNIPPPDAAPATSAMETINQAVQRMRNQLVTAFSEVNASITQTGAVVASVQAPIIQTAGSFGQIVPATQQASKGIEDFNTTSTGYMTTWATNTQAIILNWVVNQGVALAEWVRKGFETFTGFEVFVIDSIANWVTTTAANVRSWYANVESSISSWASSSYTTMSTWITNTITDLTTWSTQTGLTVSTWATTQGTNIANWATTATTNILNWSVSAIKDISNWGTKTATTISTWVTERGTEIANWVTTTGTNIATWGTTAIKNIGDWSTATADIVHTWVTSVAQNIYDWALNSGTNIANWSNNAIKDIGAWATGTASNVVDWVNGTAAAISSWASNAGKNFADWATGAYSAINGWAKASWDAFSGWLSGTASAVGNWAGSVIGSIVSWAKSAWDVITELASLVGKEVGAWTDSGVKSISNAYNGMSTWAAENKSWLVPVGIGALVVGAVALTVATGGAAAPALLALETGGIVDQEQLVRIGEKGRREAVIPLQNDQYMKPFSAAVAQDLAQILGGSGGNGRSAGTDERMIMLVGTLIADDRGLKELDRRMEVVRIQENQRRGK